MNAVFKDAERETARAAVRRIFAKELRYGYTIAGCHRYNAADGTELFRMVRLKHPLRSKIILPIHRDGMRYAKGRGEMPATGWPLYAPPYPRVETDPVLIVEGEACADALARLGITATTSGSASSANAANWTPLRGRSVRVWPDNDPAGANHADDVTAKLRLLGVPCGIVDIAALALPDKGDCVEWLAQHPDATAADVLGLKTKFADSQDSQTRDSPEPLRRPTPPPEPYPIGELGPILAPACTSLRRVIQAPDAVCGASLLAAASLAVHGLADVHNDGRVHPLSLWMLTVAESGERKSAIDAEAMRAVREYEKELTHAYDTAVVAHDAELEEWNAKRDKAKRDANKKDGAGLADALLGIGPQPDAPLLPKITVGDFTAEGLAKLLAVGRPSVGAFTDEAALVFGGHGMTKETVTRTAGTLSKLWDSGTLDRVRASDGAVKLYGRRLALHLMAQPVIAERALSDDVLTGQGFLARCLLAWPESTAGSRPYRAEDLRDDPAMIQYHSRMAHLMRLPLPLADKQRNELAPRALSLTADAAEAWRAVHNAIESAMRPGGRYATVKPWASKAPEQCLRIAGVLTLVETPGAQAIDAATIGRAGELALWHLNDAARLAGTAELSPEVRDAEALLNWCHETGRSMLYSADALRLGPARIRERERFMQAVSELESAGWAIPVEGGAMLDGARRKNVWRIVPKAEGG
jgi:Protein of unknown function (DUF3987)